MPTGKRLTQLLRSLFAAAVAALAMTLPARADFPIPGWRAALDSGSDRLALYALAQTRQPEAAPLIGALGGIVGLGHRGPGLQRLDRWAAITPILTYSGNYNAGIPGKTIRLAGLDFRVDDASRAKSGLVSGGAADGVLRYSYGPGSRLILSGRAEATALLTNGMWRVAGGGQACMQQHLSNWTWLDGCLGLSAERRSYDRDIVQRSASLGPTGMFTLGGVDQQLGIYAKYLDRNDYSQPALALNWIGAVPDIGAVGISGQIAREAEGENTALRHLSLSLVRPVADRPIRFGLDWTETGGARVFGIARRDHIVGMSVSGAVTPRLAMDAQLSRRNSNVDVYDETLVNLGLRLITR